MMNNCGGRICSEFTEMSSSCSYKVLLREVMAKKLRHLNPLSPNSDENDIFVYSITTCSNIQVMRIEEVITNDEMS